MARYLRVTGVFIHIPRVRHARGPQFLHIVTKKGKGFAPAEVDPIGYHAITKLEPLNAPAAAPAQAAPRFTLDSELFELVGVVNGHTLALYLDRADDNRPVPGAQLELELAGQRLPVTPVGDGEYRAELAAPLTEVCTSNCS